MNKKILQMSKAKIGLFFVLLSFTLHSFALEYNISFTASGASSTNDNVVIQNITQGKAVTVPAGNTLTLTGATLTNINQLSVADDYLEIFPNPINDKATLSFYSKSTGITQINVYRMDGRKVGGLVLKTEEGVNQFQIALPNGIYILQIVGSDYSYNSRIISQASTATQVKISHIGLKNTNPATLQKTKNAGISLSYSAGDILLFKASSGNFTTLKSDIVTSSKTINFNFVECKDADGNYYPVVNIGTQTWMAENLKTSQNRTSAITNQSNNANWGTLTTEGFSDYSSPSNSTTYGKLYNWYAINDSKKLSPLGWHLPTDAEWTVLSDFLGGTNVAGSKLKESGNTHWLNANTDATNLVGFYAIPGGTRSIDGSTYEIGASAYWWSLSDGTSINSAWYRQVTNLSGTLNRGYYAKSGGMSVRCVMGDLPILTTTAISNITATACNGGGNITFDGNFPITARGVCWSTTSNPTIALNTKTLDNSGTGTYASSITGLTAGIVYYVRAYATNSIGTAYGPEISFSTVLPTVTTTAISDITATTATCGGNVTAIGGAAVTERGICWSTVTNPTIALTTKTTDGTGVGTFTSAITGLTAGNTYYVRAYATNSIGTVYGAEVSFSLTLPTITTASISSITSTTTATCGGNVTAIGSTAVTERGVCWSTSPIPTISLITKTSNGTGVGTFTSSITGLIVGTTYYVRAYATNSIGTSYGAEVSFSTNLPTLSTTAISSITTTTATGGGNVTAIGGAPITARGLCWSTTPNPTTALTTKTSDGTDVGIITSNITGLVGGTTYYARSYATNSIGTAYGEELIFTTQPSVSTTWQEASSLTSNSAVCGGNIISGDLAILSRGVCWNTYDPNFDFYDTIRNPDPTINYPKSIDGEGAGIFSSQVTGLNSNSVYKARAYAVTNLGTFYGKAIGINPGAVPYAITYSPQDITTTTAKIPGSAYCSRYGLKIQGGVCWSKTADPTLLNDKTKDVTLSGTFTSNLTTLSSGSTYYARAYVVDSINIGTGIKEYSTRYGAQVIFKTLPSFSIYAGGYSGASQDTSQVIVVGIGADSTYERGICWSTNPNPTILDNKTYKNSSAQYIGGLKSGTTYYVRAYVTNELTTTYSNEINFTTFAGVNTTNISNTTASSANSGGNVTSIGGANIIARGVCWSTSTNPTIANSKTSDGTGSGSFSSTLTGLIAGTTYYTKAYATTSQGTNYGNETTFTTLCTVTTTVASAITGTIATCGGTVTGGIITAKGVCWSTSPNPTIANSKTSDGITTGAYTSSITGLTIGNTYYVRAYATNSGGTAYGPEIIFSTTLPVIMTNEITSINATTATGGGNVTSSGGPDVTAKGVCWSIVPSPTIALTTKTSNGAGIGSFTSSISGLIEGTTYYVRAYATNSIGTTYGSEVIFSTITIPLVTTNAISPVTTSSVTCGGVVSAVGGGTVVTARGVCWGTAPNPTTALTTKTSDGTGTGGFTSNITGLISGTYYYVRAYATYSIGTSYGAQVIFQAPTIPSNLSTAAITAITSTTASSGGNVGTIGSAAVTAKGVCWSTSSNPTIADNKTNEGAGSGVFNSSIIGLANSTLYYVRTYATNLFGTAYGNEISFKTFDGNITDIDGNIYNYITIGTQVWMVENLKTTHYRDGTLIPNTTGGVTWYNLATGAWCNYSNLSTNGTKYGHLYNWYAVSDSHNIAPIGWHIPTKDEWTTLCNYLGGQSLAGGKLKEVGTVNWLTPNTGATNENRFNALPGGQCWGGDFRSISGIGIWWSSTMFDTTSVNSISLNNNSSIMTSNISEKSDGNSVRCVRDAQ